MTRDELQAFVSDAINQEARRGGIESQITAYRFGKEIHISATKDGDPTDRAFYRLTLHARRGGSR